MNEQNSDVRNDGEIDLIACMYEMWHHKYIILILALIFSIAAYSYTEFLTPDTYTSYGVLHISNKTEENEKNNVIQQNDIETSKSLSTTYTEILKTRVFLREVSKASESDYTSKQIGDMMKISTVNDTELLKISITSHNAFDSVLIAKTIMEHAPDKLISVYKSGEVEIVDPPIYPKSADDKGAAKKTAIGFVFGAFVGAAYIMAHRFLDKRVHESDEVSARYNISILGETARDVRHEKLSKKRGERDEVQYVIDSETDFDTVETYKAIRTNIMFSIPRRSTGKTIAVTSASPGEGKTTTAINLAITFAQVGARVILVDCDLRRSRVHRYLRMERGKGVSNVLCGFSMLDDVIRKDERGMDILTAGEIPPNPAELLQTPEFADMISALEKNYDYIFIDTPPITVVTDAAIIIKQCAGTVLVVRSESTRFDILDKAVDEVKNTGAHVLGAVVHDSTDKNNKYGYYRGRGKYGGYRYGYGNSAKEGRKTK